MTVMAGEVEIHAGTEVLRAKQGLDHAHDLGAFLVDSRGVEIVDLVIERRPYRMREWARILDKLRGAQFAHIADALDGARALVGGEFLIAKNRETFLQTQLKPVATGDADRKSVV